MSMTPEQILIGVGAFLAAWYVAASVYNRRRGIKTYRWLSSGMATLGEKFQGKWLGSAASGAHLTNAKAAAPFRQVEAIFLLESRELLPLWLADLARGKRDQVIIKATTRWSPRAEVEIAPANSKLARSMAAKADASWSREEQDGMLMISRGQDAHHVLNLLKPIAARYGAQLRHLSYASSRPNFIAIFNLPSLQAAEVDPVELFNSIRDAFGRER